MTRQRTSSRASRGTRWLGVVLALPLVGCSSGPVQVEGDTGGANLGKVGIAYLRATEQLGRPPRNLDELKPVLQREFGDADGLLRSPNDGQPYVVIWGVDITRAVPGVTAPVVVAYERQGVGGKRYVLTVGVGIRSLTDQDFARAYFPNGHQPPTG